MKINRPLVMATLPLLGVFATACLSKKPLPAASGMNIQIRKSTIALSEQDPNINTTLQVYWFGSGCHLLKIGSQTFLTDPFFAEQNPFQNFNLPHHRFIAPSALLLIKYVVFLLLPLFSIFAFTSCGCALRGSCAADRDWNKDDFEKLEYTAASPKAVFQTRQGSSPLLLLHELPGLTPGSLELATTLSSTETSYRVYLPLFFGKQGQQKAFLGLLQTKASRRWTVNNPNQFGPVQDDLNQLIAHISTLHPEQPITVIGNCLSGDLALDSLRNPLVETVVVCQPALPFRFPIQSLNRVPAEQWTSPPGARAEIVELLRTNPNKKLISINYLNDSIAPIEKTFALIKSLQKENALKNYHLIIAYEEIVDPPLNSREHELAKLLADPSLKSHIHPIDVIDDCEHSTITGASCPDIDKFRRKLTDILMNN